jgi:hypothetical protein
VADNEACLVRHAQVAGEGERRLAFDLVAEDRDGREIGFERELVGGKERPAGNREIGLASAATEAGRTRSGADNRTRSSLRMTGRQAHRLSAASGPWRNVASASASDMRNT